MITTAVVIFASLLAFEGYRSMGGTYDDALVASRAVVARASALVERVARDTGRISLDIQTPDIGTYRGANWLVVAEGRGVNVQPHSAVLKTVPGQKSTFKLKLGDATSEGVVEVAIYDVETMRPAGRLTITVPQSIRATLARRILDKFGLGHRADSH